MLKKLQDWLKENPPEGIPYWPGARVTTPFGFRTSQKVLDMGGSFIHTGTDRSGGLCKNIEMPFSGTCSYSVGNKTIGSLTRITSNEIQLELQIFHAKCSKKVLENVAFKKKSKLPIFPSNLGLSDGVHSHMNCIIPYDEKTLTWLRENSRRLGATDALHHAEIYKLNKEGLLEAFYKQIREWSIIELWTHFLVRDNFPSLMKLPWGSLSKVIYIDSMWLLGI